MKYTAPTPKWSILGFNIVSTGTMQLCINNKNQSIRGAVARCNHQICSLTQPPPPPSITPPPLFSGGTYSPPPPPSHPTSKAELCKETEQQSVGATTSGYFAASYFFHICIKEGCTLFFFAGGWYP